MIGQGNRYLKFVSYSLLASMLWLSQSEAQGNGAAGLPSIDEKSVPQKKKPEPSHRHGAILNDNDMDYFDQSSYIPDMAMVLKPTPPLPSDVKQYLKDKYARINEDLSSNLQQTSNGPSGKIVISGDLTPKIMTDASPFQAAMGKSKKEDRVKTIARAFVEEEVALLGIKDMAELKELGLRVDEKGNVRLRYGRQIGNLSVDGVNLRIVIGPDEKISKVEADVVPSIPEMYQTVDNKTLTRGDISKIIKGDLKSTKGGSTVIARASNMSKVVIPEPPYVVWKVRAGGEEEVNGKKTDSGDWDYTIDALTGAIIEKAIAQWRQH